MQIDAKVEGAAELKAALAALGKAAPKAVRLWANWMGIEAQGQMRAELGNRFTFRNTSAQFQRAVVFQGAKASGPVQSVLKVGSEASSRTATAALGRLLARHEEGGTRSTGGTGFYVPAKGLRTSTANPPRSMYPNRLLALIGSDKGGFKKGSKKRGTGTQYFVTDKGIFRRKETQFGRAQADAIWWFKKTIRTPARLRLWETAERVVNVRAFALAEQAIEETLFRAML